MLRVKDKCGAGHSECKFWQLPTLFFAGLYILIIVTSMVRVFLKVVWKHF